MENERIPAPCSLLVRPVTIIGWLVLCIALVYFGKNAPALFFGFMFALSFCACVWGRASVRNVDYNISLPEGGVFPGQQITLARTLRNNKLLPLSWLELIEPCNPDGCAVPDGKYIIENPDITEGSEKYRCMYTFSLLKWKQTLKFSDKWTALKRGIHIIDKIELRSGDGFGLYSTGRRVNINPPRRIAVYPETVNVSAQKILNDMWDSRSESYGYLEDITIVKSVRDYRAGDPARRINQRLLARGQGLKVNQYEVVTPDSVMFILDSASFKNARPDEFEETLSVLASLIIELGARGVHTGLFTAETKYFPQTCILPSAGEISQARLLELLAAASGDDPPVLNTVPVAEPQLIGQTYYIARSLKHAASLKTLAVFPEHKTQVILYDAADTQNQGLRIRTVKSFRTEAAD